MHTVYAPAAEVRSLEGRVLDSDKAHAEAHAARVKLLDDRKAKQREEEFAEQALKTAEAEMRAAQSVRRAGAQRERGS